MPWKLGEDGNPAIDADTHRPIWIHPATKAEAPFDPDEMHGKVVSVGTEAKTHREKAEQLAAQLAGWAELGEDPKALAAELKELKKAQKAAKKKPADDQDPEAVAALQEEIHALQEKIDAAEKAAGPLKADNERLAAENRQLTVGARFNSDKHFTAWTDEKGAKRDPITWLTPEVAESHFGRHFKPDGKRGVIGYFKPGEDSPQMIHSQEDPSKPASFSECIERLLEKMPDKNSILRPLGTKGANITPGSGPRAISAEDRAKLSGVERMRRAREATG